MLITLSDHCGLELDILSLPASRFSPITSCKDFVCVATVKLIKKAVQQIMSKQIIHHYRIMDANTMTGESRGTSTTNVYENKK